MAKLMRRKRAFEARVRLDPEVQEITERVRQRLRLEDAEEKLRQYDRLTDSRGTGGVA